MSIKTVKTEELRRMNGAEGLILQGCGGDPQEWLDGINSLLTDEGILKNGSRFENISVFQNGDLTNILFPFEDGVDIDMGKLAMWRLRSHEQFGGTWLSDYVPNKLGGFVDEAAPEREKPDCKLIGEDGNVFNLMGLAARTLRRNGLAEQATEMTERVTGYQICACRCSRIYRNEERRTSDKACCSQAKENENFCSLCLGRSHTGEKAE